GLGWLAYEFGVPLALIFTMAVLIPIYHRARVISIYEYLKKRFDASTQVYVSLLFQLSRGLAAGVAVYTIGFVIAIFFGEVDPARVWPYVVAVGVVTVFYDALGGIRAVIWSDVVQMSIIFLGVLALTYEAYTELGGLAPLLRVYAEDAERFRILQFEWGYGDGQTYAFWPMLLGGFFLYISYYGCDQSQVQRELSVGCTDDVKRSLLLNAFGRFPVVFFYSVMGLFIGSLALLRPGFREMIPPGHPDWMVPLFIVNYLPAGLVGLLLIAVLAAGMSSLDSALNSMSACTMRDIYQPYVRPNAGERHYLIASKLFTVFWGVITLLFSFFVPYIGDTVIEAINKVGSLLYAPIFAAFFLGILTRWATPLGAKLGVTAGILINLYLWLGVPQLSWLWWNVTGMVVAVTTAFVVSKARPAESKTVPLEPESPARINWPLRYGLIIVYFAGMIGFCAWLQGNALR
ncbi:MAG TPA: sodium/solute symporter, partial [Candidatus Acidoferrales bacterium]|nr:sodium/solute symporter [Candidatus Acidoferrales bacterium]